MFKRKKNETYREFDARTTGYLHMGIVAVLVVLTVLFYSLACTVPDLDAQHLRDLNGAAKYQAREGLKDSAKPAALGGQQ